MPFVFVILWSTGFIVAKFGLPYAPPLTFLMLRFVGVLVVLVPLVVLMRAPWPTGKIWHIALAGALLQAGYVGGVWTAINTGMPAGLAALIVGMQPVLTAFAAPMVGESMRRRQWLGMVLGFCGVALVVSNKISLIGLGAGSIVLALMALFSITVGTLYQKRFCAQFDLRTGTVIQFAASAVVLLPFAVYFEGMTFAFDAVRWTPPFVGALLWSVLALSIGAIFLLFALIRRQAATSVTSYLYLTPPTTALMAWLMFGEVFSLVGVAGMLLAIVGVFFVVRKA
ncbi:MAG: eamA-like transporter family protein [Paucimonas sp.]|nr:eamA-like transporter family protein [Paucimonas sp.]